MYIFDDGQRRGFFESLHHKETSIIRSDGDTYYLDEVFLQLLLYPLRCALWMCTIVTCLLDVKQMSQGVGSLSRYDVCLPHKPGDMRPTPEPQ